MAMMSLGERFGSDCLDFVSTTVCFLEALPQYIPPNVVVEPVNSIRAQGCQTSAPWHLPRLLDTKPLANYRWDGDGSAIDVYVLDTWVDCSHRYFGGRCRELKRFAEHQESARPMHGTHVAGLVGSSKHGAAKRANIKSVVVLGDDGRGWFDDFAKALHYVVQRIRDARNKRAIVNMSLKGGRSRVLDQLVEELQTSNIAMMVIAAGNDNLNACDQSPNSRRVAIVGSTNLDNALSSFSNTGECVSISAPGESIQSLCQDQQECWMSGTSMAAPLTAGAIAVYWDTQPSSLNAQGVWTNFRAMALKNKLKVRANTPNLLAHLDVRSRCLADSELAARVLFFQ